MVNNSANKQARRIKIQISGDCWTIYRDNKFVAKGVDSEGETVIEENKGAMSNDLIYLLIEDALGK